MNNKEIYNKLVKILNGEDKEVVKTLENIKKELETDITTNGKINNNIKQAFKRLQKENDIRTKFQNVLRNGDDKFTITNTFYLITYTAEQLPAELKSHINPNEKEIDDGLQYEKLKNKNELSLLSLNFELMQKTYRYNKLNKKRNIFTLQNGYTINLQYFFDIITLLGYKNLKNVKLSLSDKLIDPMNIETANGNAILLPIRMNLEDIEKQLKLQEEIFQQS